MFKNHLYLAVELAVVCHLGVGNLILLDKDEGGRDQRALTHVVHWVVGHRLQQPQRLLHKTRR